MDPREARPHNAPIARDAIKSRIDSLQAQIRGILSDPEVLESYDAEVGPDVTKATMELDGSLRAWSSSLPAPDDVCRDEPPPKTSEIDSMNGRPELPPLPPILDASLERATFTHPGMGKQGQATYDRLEILGDAYIELIATKLVWKRFEDLASGRLSQIRESLIKNETLSEFATRYGFGNRALVPPDYFGLPKRLMKTRGDIFEAYVAAVIVSNPSAGYSVAEQWLTELWMPRLATVQTRGISVHEKETLAKKVMSKGIRLKYVDEGPPVHGVDGCTFSIGVYLTGWGWTDKHLGSGQGTSKAIAGNQAAGQALVNEPLISEIIAAKKIYEADRMKRPRPG